MSGAISSMRFIFSLVFAIAALVLPARADDAAAARGRYLALLGDCAGCHTGPKKPAFTGGLAFNTPFGTIYSTNITPDRATGIGAWTADDFYRALHDGVAPGGRHLYPALPYLYFTRISRAESDDLFAYLQTVKPVRRAPTPNRLMFPFNLRFGMIFWNWLYLDRTPPRIPAKASPQWRRGEYLVNGLGHCAACHTPKDALFGDERSMALSGGLVDNWFASDITNGGLDGLGKWTQADVQTFLKTGHNRLTTVAGSMKEKITASISQMHPHDIAAIATYLKSTTSPQPPPQGAPRPEDMARGRGIYGAYCASCHAGNGAPAPGTAKAGGYPSLAGNTLVLSRDATTLLRIILTGGAAPAAPGQPPTRPMPAFAKLDDGQVADVTNYIRNSWGNAASPVSATAVHNLRRALAASPP